MSTLYLYLPKRLLIFLDRVKARLIDTQQEDIKIEATKKQQSTPTGASCNRAAALAVAAVS